MNKLVIAGIGLAGLMSGSAMAADLRPPAPAPVEFFTWSGGYVGVNLGGGWRQPVDFVSTAPPCTAPTCLFGTPAGFFSSGPADLALISALGTGQGQRANGATGGFQAGYNYQVGAVVVGVEADWEYFKRDSSIAAFGRFPIAGGAFVVSNDASSSWLATIRGRIGVAWDRVLVYATGGVAFTNLTYTQTLSVVAVAVSSIQATSVTRSGGTVGGGVEYALWNNLTLRTEYLYSQFTGVSLGGALVHQLSPTFSNPVVGSTGNLRDHIVRIGLNYKFGGGAVVASY